MNKISAAFATLVVADSRGAQHGGPLDAVASQTSIEREEVPDPQSGSGPWVSAPADK
jgi:hypothetical protein